MGMLIDGRWTEHEPQIVGGRFERARSAITGPPSLAPLARDGVARYHLIASRSCPWSHAVLLLRALKGFGDTVPVHHAHGERVEGYALDGGRPWAVPGIGRHVRHLHELYTLGDPAYTGRASVPLLWDIHERCVVSNDSGALLHLLNASAGPSPAADPDLLPADLRDEINATCVQIHRGLANAVYRAGFATEQDAYDVAVSEVFTTLDRLEHRLATRRLLLGRVLTVADLRLFATLVRKSRIHVPIDGIDDTIGIVHVDLDDAEAVVHRVDRSPVPLGLGSTCCLVGLGHVRPLRAASRQHFDTVLTFEPLAWLSVPGLMSVARGAAYNRSRHGNAAKRPDRVARCRVLDKRRPSRRGAVPPGFLRRARRVRDPVHIGGRT